MHKGFLTTAIFMGALSVLLGAFAAHTLKKYLTPESLATFETAVRYQFYHVFALALTGILYKEFPAKTTVYAGRLFILGIIFFSGSLYMLSLLGADKFKWLGALTPIGGACFILGWSRLGLGILQKPR